MFVLMPFSAHADDAVKRLSLLIAERFSYMQDVALYKARNQIPVEDVERESVVVQKGMLAAERQGLDPDSYRKFIEAQITVAKAIQYRYRAYLLTHSSMLSIRNGDLEHVIRPKLIEIGSTQIAVMAGFLKAHTAFNRHQLARIREGLSLEYVSKSDIDLLIKSLAQVRAK